MICQDFFCGLFFPLLFLFFHFENNYEGPSINSFILCRIPEIMARKIFHMRVFLARNCAKMNVFFNYTHLIDGLSFIFTRKLLSITQARVQTNKKRAPKFLQYFRVGSSFKQKPQTHCLLHLYLPTLHRHVIFHAKLEKPE